MSCVPVDVEAPLVSCRMPMAGGAGCLDYRRVPAGAAGPTAQVLVFGDPQVKSETDVDYFRRDIVQPIHGRIPATLGLTFGRSGWTMCRRCCPPSSSDGNLGRAVAIRAREP